VQRRLTAILAADMVGYSRLMAADEAGTLERLKAMRGELIAPNIAANGGRIVKLIGDGLLVVFDSVAGAVTAAAKIQKAVQQGEAAIPAQKRIAFRVGIHLGDVIVEGDDVYGEGVNLAARLEGVAPSGGICLSEDAWHQVHGKVDLAFDDLGERELKNIPGRHRVFAVNLDPARLSPEEFEALTGERLELPDKPSLAVLPFDNMSGDPEQEFFADGITEDILTTLSKVSDMVVIARNSTFAYKGRTRDVRQIGRELGVSHVLEGSVQKGGNRVRITAQLIDTRTGDHVWAERYDRTLDDIFAVQDEITREIVVSLSVRLTHGEEIRIWSSGFQSFEAWESLSRATTQYWRFTKEGNAEARRLARDALRIEPGNRWARILLGWARTVGVRYGWIHDRDAAVAEAESLATELIALDPADADAHALMSFLLLFHGRYDEAIAEGEKAIELAPSMASYHGSLAIALYYAGRYEDCLKRIRKAMRLSPFFPHFFLWLLAEGYRGTGQTQKALKVLEHYAARAPDTLTVQVRLARLHADMGNETAAHTAAETVLSIEPDFSAKRFVESVPFRDRSETEKFVAALRAAGLPE